MKRARNVLLVLMALLLLLSLAACGGNDQPTSTPTNKPASTPTNKPQTGDLSISVMPGEMTMYAGDEIDLMMGVTASDSSASVRISDDNDFDYETPGTYTITYEAKLGDKTVTGTRVITVLTAKSNIAVEVAHNYLGEAKWPSKIISFANSQYVELSADTQLEKQSGVFKNTSSQPITLTINGTHGISAIIDANGAVIEGRDGANSKLVNAQYPERAGSTMKDLTINGEAVSVSSSFAKEMVIPAGGYAIVVQSSEFGTTADTDGRNFMNYNVINHIGNVVRLYWVDTNETLTPYVNQKPTVSGNTKMLVKFGDTEFDFATAVLMGIITNDDNGTFDLSDDTAPEITIVNDGGFNINVAGIYTVSFSITDGEYTTEFTREVEVKASGMGTITIGDKKMNVSMDLVAVDQDMSKEGNYAFIIYTYAYKANGGVISFSDGHGAAIIVDAQGNLVRIYDGANAKYYDAENLSGLAGGCNPTAYLTEAFESLKEGEKMIIATNSEANNAAGGSRKFLLDNKNIGVKVTGPEVSEEASTDRTITIGDKTLTVEDGKWLYNTPVEKTTTEHYQMIIYDKKFTGTFETNGFGCAIVLDQYGVLIKVYDGANLTYYTTEGKGTVNFTTHTYASVAWSELQDGETLIIFPNGGDNSHRKWALDLRGAAAGSKSYMGETATVTGLTFKKKEN